MTGNAEDSLMKEYRYFSDQSSILTKNRRKPKAYEITGAKIETDAEGNITQKGFDQAVSLMQLYCDNEYESARYLFVTKEGDIICHLAFSNGIPNSTLPYPDENEINEIRNYTLENDCQIIFFHNHPNGFVEPSPADISLTEKLSEILIDNSMKKRLAAHIILDTGSDTYGFWNKDSHDWSIHYKGMFHSINEYNSDVESRRLIINHNLEPDRKLIYLPVGDEKTPQYLSQMERVYNSDGEWDKDWIPAFFLKEYGIVEHIEYIHKSLLNDYKAFDSKLQDIGTKTGSTRCYLLPSDYEIAVECMKYAEKSLSYKGKVYENGTIEAVYCSDENIPSQLRCRVYGRSVFDNLGSRNVKIRDDSRNYPLGYSMKNIDISETESSKEINNMSEIKSVLPEEIVKYVNANSLWAITEAQAKQYIESFKRAGLEITVDLENKRLGVSGNTAGTIFEDFGEKNLDIPDIQLFIEKEDERTRTDIVQQIRESMPNLSDEERASALSILEAGAKSMGLSISEYVAQTFPEGIFGNIAEAQKAAWKQGKEMNGAVVVDGFGENARAVIYASRTADFSTWVHEIAHIWQAQLTGNLKRRAEEAFQVQGGDWKKSIYTFADGHTDSSGEAFAYGFEDCLKNAESEFSAPDKKRIYEKFAQYMSRTYNGLVKNIEISDEIRKVYDAFLLVDDNILAKAEKAVRMEKEFSANRLNTIEHRHAEESAFQYQIVGENSIRAMSKSLERNRILSNLTAAVALDESITNVTGEAKVARIRIETGWEKDASGQWKYETDDSISRIKNGSAFEKILNTNPKALTSLTADGKTMKLSDILDAQELFSIFPVMKDVNVRFYDDPDTYRALLDSDGIMINTHYLNTTNGEKGLKGVLAHEIQHIIQAIEYTGKNDLKGENLEELYLEAMKAMREANTRIYDYDTNSVDAGIERYMREAGEIEARNVARRIAFSDSERRHKTLQSTEDISRKFQFQSVKYNEKSLENTETRTSYLKDKTELTDEDIINILDLPLEKPDYSKINVITEKNFSEAKNSNNDLEKIKKELLQEKDLLKYHNSYISKSKLLYTESRTLCNEIAAILLLNEIKMPAFLLPFGLARKDKKDLSFADALKIDENIFTEFKRVFSNSFERAYKDGIKQSEEVFISLTHSEIDRDKTLKQLIKIVNGIDSDDKSCSVLFYNEKNKECFWFDIDKNGYVTEKEIPALKESGLASTGKPSAAERIQQGIPSTDININENKIIVNNFIFESLLDRGAIIEFQRNKRIHNRQNRYLDTINHLESITTSSSNETLKKSNDIFIQKEKKSQFYKNIQFQEIKHKEFIMNASDYQNKLSEDERNILKLNLTGNSYARHTDLERFGHPNEIGKGKDMLINFTTCDGKNMELKTKDDVTSYVIEMQSKINSMKNYISKDELKDLKKVLKEINTHLKQFPNNEEASHKLSSRLSSLENKVRFYQENHSGADGNFDANIINYPNGYEKTIEVFNAVIEHRTEIIRDADLSDAIKKALGINNEYDISLFDAAFGKERLRQREYNEDISADKILEAFFAAKLGIPNRYEISKMGIPDNKYNNIYSRINIIAHLNAMNPGDSDFNKSDSIYKFKDYKMVIAKQVTDASIHNIEFNSFSEGLDFVSEILSDDIKKDMWKDAGIEPHSIENEVEQDPQVQFQEITNELGIQTDVHELKGDDLKKDFMSVLAADFYLKPKEQSFAEMFSEKLMSRYSPAQLGEINSIVLNMTGANSKSEVFSSLEKLLLELQKNTEQAVSEDLLTKDFKALSEKYMNSSPVEKEAFKKVFDETIQVKLGNDLSKESPDTTELSKIVQTRFITADISDRILNGKALEGRDGERLVSLNSIDDVIKYIQSDPQRFERSEWFYGKDTERFKQADREKSIEKQKTNSEGLSQDNHNPENVASISDVEQNLSDNKNPETEKEKLWPGFNENGEVQFYNHDEYVEAFGEEPEEKNALPEDSVNISNAKQDLSDNNDTSISEKEVNSDELKFTKTPIDKSQVTTEIPTVNLNPESIASEHQEENQSGNNINSKEFLLGALKCNSPEEYEEYYKNNYHFNGKAAFKPSLPIADNKMVLYINGKETKKVFDNTKEQLASMSRWCVEQGFDFLIPTPEDVKKYGRDAIVKNVEILNKLLGTDITQEQSNSLTPDTKQQTDVNKGQGNSTPMLYANGTLTEQEMELFQHLEIDKISEFIKDPYQHDVAVPKFGYEKVNPQTGKTELIEQTGWHFAQKEIQAGTVSSIILTKMNENGQREFLKLDPTTYEAMVNRGSELMKTWNQPLSKEAHLASVYSYEDSLKIERSSRRSNTCCNYLHNFMAMCRGEDGGTPANNIKEAMAVAAKIYYQMSPHEKERLKKMEKEWNESHDNTFQEELERRFKEIIKERVYSHDDLAYAGHDNKGYVNKAGLEANSGNRLLEEKTGKKIGDSVKLSINFKNTKGDVFQLDTAEYKIAGASREQNCICVINSQTNEKWEMPLDKFIERQQQINKKQEKIQQHHVKTEKKTETKQKQKENDLYSMGL